jgi:hypothetical protein
MPLPTSGTLTVLREPTRFARPFLGRITQKKSKFHESTSTNSDVTLFKVEAYVKLTQEIEPEQTIHSTCWR